MNRKIDHNTFQTSENRFNFFDRHTISGAAARGKNLRGGQRAPVASAAGGCGRGAGAAASVRRERDERRAHIRHSCNE